MNAINKVIHLKKKKKKKKKADMPFLCCLFPSTSWKEGERVDVCFSVLGSSGRKSFPLGKFPQIFPLENFLLHLKDMAIPSSKTVWKWLSNYFSLDS